MPNLPEDFVPENSDVMSPEEEYELIQIFESIDPNDMLADFVEVERPSDCASEAGLTNEDFADPDPDYGRDLHDEFE